MPLEPALDDLGAVNGHVVADHRDHRRARVGGRQLPAEGGEGGADRFAGHPVEEASAGQIHRTEDRPPPILPGGHDFLVRTGGDPGGADPGQQG